GATGVSMGTVFARNEVSPGRTIVMGITLFARRFSWYVRALGSNPLIRASDRLEAFAIVAVLATAVLAFPVAAHVGSQIYDAGVHMADEQAHTRHPVQAMALASSSSMSADFDNPVYVSAQWHEGTQLRTEQVIAPT